VISAADAFAPLRAALEAAGVRYAVGGSWASTAFGEPRFTNDVDILADFTPANVEPFFDKLPETFFGDLDETRKAIRLGRPFNVIYMPMASHSGFRNWIERNSWRGRDFPTTRSRSLPPRIFCWPNCTGFTPEAKYLKCNGEIFSASFVLGAVT
jgi:hypothetical protein